MRILLGISGGLDSAYAAKKLIAEGHEVEGAILVLHPYAEIESAREAARQLGIPLHEIDGRERFRALVQKEFASEYLRGRTPNPCVICNRTVKLPLLYEYAMANGFDRIATGHYAFVKEENGRYAIAMGRDASRDQSYVLWPLSQEILSRLCLPLADMEKEDIRTAAREEGLSVAVRKESREICFIPDGDYAGFIRDFAGIPAKEGDFVDENGKVLGRHAGILNYTVGQRKGLGISLGKRMFVTAISAENNTVTLSDDPNVTVSEFYIESAVFSGLCEPAQGEVLAAQARVRYQSPLRTAQVTYLGQGRAHVMLSEPARAVTPGQSAVFYKDGTVLFGGVIADIAKV